MNYNIFYKQLKIMKFAVFAALLATASASTITFNDTMDAAHCDTHKDCPMFFNEPMVCATVTEVYTEEFRQFGRAQNTTAPVPRRVTEIMNATYNHCTLHALCGTDFKSEIFHSNVFFKGTATCMPNAPPMPTTSLVTAEHVETMTEMMKVKREMQKHSIAQKLLQ